MSRAALLGLMMLATGFAGCLGVAQEPLTPSGGTMRDLPPEEPVHNLTHTNVTPSVTAPPPPPPDPHAGLPHLRLALAEAWGADLLPWQGGELRSTSRGACVTCPVAAPPPQVCEATNCERTGFHLDIPQGYWTNHTGAVEVTIAWPHANPDAPWFRLTVLDGAGEVVGVGNQGLYAQTVRMPNATSGNYTALVQVYGAGTYLGVVQVEAQRPESGPPRDLLPDLVTLKPTDLKVRLDSTTLFLPWVGGALPDATPDAAWLALGLPYNTLADGPGGSTTVPRDGERALAAAGVVGCDPFEASGGARRCLRFSNFIGNAGEGVMDLHLVREQTHAPPLAPYDFTQRIHRTDGSAREVPAGNGSYHLSHAHLHYNGIASYTLFAYDLTAHRRGEQVGAQSKAGWCFGNEGLVALGAPTTAPPQDGNCDVWGDETDLPQYLAPNWFDGYESYRPEQYIEITGVQDGVYELVSVADPDNTITEADETNNEASVVFRLAGDQVEVLW